MDMSFTAKFVDGVNKSVDSGAAPVAGELVAKSVYERLSETMGATKAMQVINNVIAPVAAKSMGTVDIVPLRAVDLPDSIAMQYNEEVRFLDWLKAKPNRPITDYQLKIIEERIGTQTSSLINLDSTTLPNNVQANFSQRFNTLTCTGDTIQISFLADNINNLQQIGNVSLFENQVAMEAVRIRRKMNQTLLSNTEVVAEAPPIVPQLGGFITRSTNGPIACSNSNLTNALLQQGVDQIATYFGSMGQLALFCNKAQMAVIRDLMINRFPGENSATHVQLMREGLASVGQAARGLMTNVVYQPYPGMFIPVYYDQDMPANTALLFKVDGFGAAPQLATMSFDGQNDGIHIAMRPYAPMFSYALVFQLYSLHDPLVEGRVVYQNVGS